jgi:hypothetical protein
MDYQVSVTVEELAQWYVRLTGLADAHHKQPVEEHLRALAQEVYGQIPSEWWATQPEPLDNRVRN